MAQFDFIECSVKAYGYIWQNRMDLLRPTALVLAVKFSCFVLVFLLGLEDNLLRQGLVLMPSYFVEGWIIAHIMITALSREKDHAYQIPTLPPARIADAVMASMIIYVLLKLTMSLFIGVPLELMPGMSNVTGAAQPETTEPNAALFFAAIGFLVFTVWAFRFLWLYIPPVLGISAKAYIRKLGAVKGSYPLIGLWLLCFIPMALALAVLSQIVSIPADVSLDQMSAAHKYALSLLQGLFDYAIALVSSLGMAYGIASMFNKENKTVSLL